MNWVDPSKTLREQGIDEGEPVLLRRKFFFSDGNIDSHDPVQLNLLYVQVYRLFILIIFSTNQKKKNIVFFLLSIFLGKRCNFRWKASSNRRTRFTISWYSNSYSVWKLL